MTIREIDYQGITVEQLEQRPGANYTLTCRTCVKKGKRPGSVYLGNISLKILGVENHSLAQAREQASVHEELNGSHHNLNIIEIIDRITATKLLEGDLEAEDVGPTY